MALRARGPDPERTYTPQEFEALPQFDELYELVNGLLKFITGDTLVRSKSSVKRTN